MEINILTKLEGAKHARGLTVIIDVFRAFSVECFLADMGVGHIIPKGPAQECIDLKKANPDYFLIGERKGVKLEGFDLGNSPSQLVTGPSLKGRTIVHSTSAGTQGVAYAVDATEVLVASFLNAAATARYILSRKPEVVTIVGMGLMGEKESEEDNLCASYIKALILGENPNINQQLADLKNTSGKKFFTHNDEASFPEPDFFMCLVPNVFDFVLKADKTKDPIEIVRIDC